MKPIIKIPLRLAPELGVHNSLIVRWNQGKRTISYEMAMRIVDVLQKEGIHISILDLKPDLERLIPYLCRSRYAKQRKLRKGPQLEANCPAE